MACVAKLSCTRGNATKVPSGCLTVSALRVAITRLRRVEFLHPNTNIFSSTC